LARSPLSVVRFLKVFVAWWLIWASLHAVLLWWIGFDWRVAVTDSGVYNGLSAFACLLLCFVMQFYLPQEERYWYILFISILLSSLIAFAGKYTLQAIYENDASYQSMLRYSLPIRWGIAFLLIVCMSMIGVLWYSFQDQQETEKRKNDAETLSKEAELFALRRQLQPHFLFNSLNSISALVGSRPQEARNMIQQLSDFLRGTIKKEENKTVPLAEEMQHLQLYLAIEQVRFGHRLNTQISTSEESNAMKIPALILQPIVENAIKFGLYDTIGNVTISIDVATQNNQLIITIKNPYDPETAQPHKGEGFGLSSVQRRLYLLYARNDLVQTETENNFFTTTVKIPQLIYESADN
jgi:two-component system LytT family sensor kinase